jgi:hypothetical protein
LVRRTSPDIFGLGSIIPALQLHFTPEHSPSTLVEELMEAHKLDRPDHSPKTSRNPFSEGTEPFRWGLLPRVIHPLIWAWIAALWLGLAWLIIFEAG